MTPKDWTDYNLQWYEKKWFERLENIKPGELRTIIDHQPALNQSANFKYKTINRFITVLMGYNSERQQLALDIIEKYWKNLEKSDLLGNLLHHAPFEFFKKYFSKARLKPEQVSWFIVSVLKHDSVEEAEWIINHKKFDTWLDEENVGFIDGLLENRLKKANPEVINLVSSKEEVVKIVIEKGYVNLLPQEAKDLFLF